MRVDGICAHCHIAFSYIKNNRGRIRKYCSRVCQFRSSDAKKSAQALQARSNLICQGCGIVFVGVKSDQKYCSMACRLEATKYERTKVGFEAQCERCRKTFIRNTPQHRFCSRTCKRAGGYSSDYRSRAKHFGVEFDGSLTLHRAIERFGLICAECNELILASHSDRPNPDGPSLDHVVPMSMGGGHVWSNVEIVHMRCNALRYRRMRNVEVAA